MLLGKEEGLRLAEVTKEVNRMRGRLKKEYFDQRLDGAIGDLRATWEVLGEVLRGRRGRAWAAFRYIEQDGVAVTDREQIAGGWWGIYRRGDCDPGWASS